MKKILLFTTLSLSSIITNAQTFAWAASLGSGSNEEGRGITVDAIGNVYSVGYFTGSGDFDPGVGVATLTSAGSSDVYVSKLNALGNYVWAFRLGGTGPQAGTAITLDDSGNVYIAGHFNNSIDMDPGPGVVNFTSLGSQDVFIAKYDSAGNHIWSKRFGSAAFETVSSITIDSSGNVLTCGSFTGTTDFDPGAGVTNLTAVTTSDGYISKLNLNGNYIWAKQIGLNGTNSPAAVVCDPTGNIYLTGGYEATTDFNPGAGSYTITSAGVVDIFFLKLDINGDFSWAGSMGGTAYDLGRSLAIDAAGNVVVTGEFQGTADLDPTVGVYNLTAFAIKDIFIAKFNPATASFIWSVKVGETYNDIAYGIATDASNNIYVTGDFTGTVDFDPGAGSALLTSDGNQKDCFILKLDASGNYLWAGRYGSSFLADAAYSIYVDASTHIYTTGSYQDVVDFDPGAGTYNLTSGGQVDVYALKIAQCAAPVAPTNTTPIASLTICGYDSTTLTAIGSGTLGWYSASTGGTYLGAGTSYTTPVLNNGVTYYVQDSTCLSSPRTAISVTVDPPLSTNTSSITNVTCNAGSDGAATIIVGGGTPNYTFSWSPFGGTSPSASNLIAGNYTCTVTDAVGCTIPQVVTITEPAAIDVTTTLNGNMLSANQNGATYQWIDCLIGNAPVAGETNQSFIPQLNSDYAVIVTVGPCSDTSACTNVITAIDVNENTAFSLYPNPTDGIITIQFASAFSTATIEVTNALGQIVSSSQTSSATNTIELPEQAGMYFVLVTVDGITTTSKVVKQ